MNTFSEEYQVLKKQIVFVSEPGILLDTTAFAPYLNMEAAGVEPASKGPNT